MRWTTIKIKRSQSLSQLDLMFLERRARAEFWFARRQAEAEMQMRHFAQRAVKAAAAAFR